MMAPGFRPVGWVAAVAGSAIGCYMLSLNVASERADLLRIEQQIIAAKQDIRSLQTELGTRGRLAQLEQWNADVLALSAPSTPQFLDNEVKLARFDQSTPTLEERTEVRMAAAEVAPQPARKIDAPVLKASAPEVPASTRSPLLHQASLTVTGPKVQPAALMTAEPARAPRPAASLPAASKPIKAASVTSAPKPIRMASADMPKPAKPEAKPASRIDSGLAQQIAAAARLEVSRRER